MSFHSALYRGRLVHARNDVHARRAFRYPVFVASVDLDELDVLACLAKPFNTPELQAPLDRAIAQALKRA